MPPPPSGEDTIRILVATDNHVGYEERDPIRKDDSWKTFDEILNLARTQDVDMVLLGGDLFHENRPSRKSMYQVMRSLRKNCLGMKPCELEFLSDAAEVFEGAFNNVNYEDPDMNISIPVFSIHGNHDDPSGDGYYCSLDLLQVAGLVNYFGRVPEADNIKVKPVLFQKGRTKLALFGLSNVRDERMFRTFRDHKVTFFRPTQQSSDFFNLLTVHQNHHAHTATSYLPEKVLPDWMDLVVWGHEHECDIDPRKNDETGFHVMQPGSSVATSLVPSEAVPKHVAILSITGKDFQVEKIALKTVRPFITRDIVLSQEKEFTKLHTKKDNRQEITKRLMKIVDQMIDEANEDWLSLQEDPDNIDPEDVPLPLIRLKVEYTAPEGGQYECENPQRFSNRFVGKVANVNDVVYFHRKKAAASKREKGETTLPMAIMEALDDDNAIKVGVLVTEFLAQESLQVLPQNQFIDAVISFVEKGGNTAMEDFVSESLARQLHDLLTLNPEDNNLDGAMKALKEAQEKRWAKEGEHSMAGVAKKRLKPQPEDWDDDLNGYWADQPHAWEIVPRQAPSRSNGRGRGKTAQHDEDEDVDMDAEEPAPAKKAPARRGAAARTTKAAAAKKARAPPPKKAPARGRGKTRGGFVVSSDDDEEEEEQRGDGASEDLFASDDDEDPPAPPPKRAAARSTRATASRASTTRATRAAPAKKQTTLNFSQSQRPTQRSTQRALEVSDDEIEEDEDDAFESMPSTRSRRR